jgi:hypothetical protein
MLVPTIDARLKEPHDLFGHRIDAGNVGPFELVASTATECEVSHLRLPAVLSCDDVIENVRETLPLPVSDNIRSGRLPDGGSFARKIQPSSIKPLKPC